MTVEQIIQTAREQAAHARGNPDVIVAKMGLIPARAGLLHAGLRAQSLTIGMPDALHEGLEIFEKFRPYVKKAVCTDFGYCAHRQTVDKALDAFLAPIVKAIVKRLPISGTVPGWLAKALKLLGISATSMDVVIALFVAWLIVQGCNALCECGS